MQSFIALGGNLGDVESTFQSALEELGDDPQVDVRRISSVYRTSPMGEEAGEGFRNAAAELEVDCPPLELLDILNRLESRHGRDRRSRWGPRTLDLDLLLYGTEVFEHPRLIVPHPGCWYRRFVLDPLAEIAPDVVHPIKGQTVCQLRDRLLIRPFAIGIAGGMISERTQLAESLSGSPAEVLAKPWSPEEGDWPVLLLWIGTPSDQNLEFEDLPLLPRLDLTSFPEDSQTASRHILAAALPTETPAR